MTKTAKDRDAIREGNRRRKNCLKCGGTCELLTGLDDDAHFPSVVYKRCAACGWTAFVRSHYRVPWNRCRPELRLVEDPVTILDRATTIARDVRTELLRFDETPRNLAGECGLAAMLVASVLGKPNAIRTGFYMKRETFCGRRGRYPHRHAWCRVGPMIVDVTATQFDRRSKAVHVARFDEDIRYIETARGAGAIDNILINWRGRELPVYIQLAKGLQKRLHR